MGSGCGNFGLGTWATSLSCNPFGQLFFILQCIENTRCVFKALLRKQSLVDLGIFPQGLFVFLSNTTLGDLGILGHVFCFLKKVLGEQESSRSFCCCFVAKPTLVEQHSPHIVFVCQKAASGCDCNPWPSDVLGMITAGYDSSCLVVAWLSPPLTT